MSILITGVAGFIGSNLAKRFVSEGKNVVGFDNLCRGSLTNIESLSGHSRFAFCQVDLAAPEFYRTAMKGFHEKLPITEVWHMAANSDIPAGVENLQVDLRDTFMTTVNTLQVMKELRIRVIAFASSSAIYGDLGEVRIGEDIGPLFPISNYGAMKLASEAVISAAVEDDLEQAYIFRFPNVIGIPATHGVMLDFIRKLKVTPERLDVLGDGTQQKSYLHVAELIDAMLFIREHAADQINYFNIGADDDGVTVSYIAEQVVATVAPTASISYGKGNKGWVGDVPKFAYSTEKLRKLGWHPKLKSAEAIRRAVRQIAEQESRQ